ncbi:MAG TPA: response regulator transcription factor [Verrucomicrobiae bacterium]|jgi:DNA-binding NarL/FixJ family response regulator|nr:response regulator transcription factor [Verrucomicrobiae bacterium]
MAIAVSIVEDDAGLCESICRFIQGAPGFQCLGAYASAEEALADVPNRPPAVVLMDINLPKMSGIECVKHLKEKLPGLQIIMLTVYENSDRIFEALAAGACGYLVKNTPPEKLLEAIEDIAKGGSPMSSHIARKLVQAFQPAVCAVPLIEQLAPREQQVLELLSKGRAYKQIAGEMNLSMGTIRTYIRRIYEKLHVNCRTDAVVKYLHATGSERRPISRA